MGGNTWCLCLCLSVLLVGGGCRGQPTPAPQEDVSSVCEMRGCNCSSAQSDKWIIVNCTFNNRQIVDLRAGLLPVNTMELSINGGEEVKLGPQLFAGVRNLWRLRIDSTRRIVFNKYTLINLTVTNFLVQIQHCDSLIFESYAFSNEGPVVLEVMKCGHVTVRRSVWSFLQSATIEDIPRLELHEGAFILKPRVNERHGPVTTIKFRNVVIPTLPKDAFKATLAEVSFADSEVRQVMSDAFSGNTISSVIFINTSVHDMYATAFSERTLLHSLEISHCRLHVIFTGAVLSATTNLTIQHSKITTIHSGALNATIARTIFVNNSVGTFHSRGFALHDWSQVTLEYNTIEHMHTDGLDVPYKSDSCQDPCEISFANNDIGTTDSGALKFVSVIPEAVVSHFDNNNFQHTCHCEIDGWLEDILGSKCPTFAQNNFCFVDSLLAACYDVQKGPAYIRNFTDTICSNEKDVLNCKTYSVDANIVNNELNLEENNSQLIFGLVLGLVLLIAVSGTVVILLIHGGLWLKRKGYCVRFQNFQYRVEEESTEVEDIMVTQDKIPETHLPEELSQDLLQTLREKLEDPLTYNEAREMIERLYDHFIIEDSYTNNNRQEEETHLYEELGNLNNPEDKPARPFSFLRLIEERFNLTPEQPKILSEYSEPTDAEVHLYSELPNKEGKQNEINENIQNPGTSTQRSNGSMAYRPLPDKPKAADPGEGPSTKF